MILSQGRSVLEIEAEALRQLAASLDHHFEAVVRCLVTTRGRVILTGVGKSGIICRKIAATFASTGTPAFFVHPTEAIHGDLGMIVEGDVVMAVSNSGETSELLQLLEYIKRQGARLIAITGNPHSTLARMSDLPLSFQIEKEGCPMGLAPMASTTATLALGDALAAAVMEQKGFTSSEFARYHPGGKLGKTLILVGDVIAKHQGCPLVQPETLLADVLIEISDKRLGMTAVDLNGQLGLITDGDIRRLFQQHGKDALELKADQICTRGPKTIGSNALAVEALKIMESYKITSLIVLDGQGSYIGVVHLHDLWQTQMV